MAAATTGGEGMIEAYRVDPSDANFRALRDNELGADEMSDLVYAVASTRQFVMPVLAHLCYALFFSEHLAECAFYLRSWEQTQPSVDVFRLSAYVAARRCDLHETARAHNKLVAIGAPQSVQGLTALLVWLVHGDPKQLSAILETVHLNLTDWAGERQLPQVFLQAALRLQDGSAAASAVIAQQVHGLDLGLGVKQENELKRLMRTTLLRLIARRPHA